LAHGREGIREKKMLEKYKAAWKSMEVAAMNDPKLKKLMEFVGELYELNKEEKPPEVAK
jgi:hypothetical protein